MVFNPANAGSVAAAAARPGVAYVLGRTLYLAMTNRSNAATIIETRGPGFAMPPEDPIAKYMNDPWSFEHLREFMVREGLRNSPEARPICRP